MPTRENIDRDTNYVVQIIIPPVNPALLALKINRTLFHPNIGGWLNVDALNIIMFHVVKSACSPKDALSQDSQSMY